MITDQMKPCPLCGGAAKSCRGIHGTEHCVSCMDDTCEMSETTLSRSAWDLLPRVSEEEQRMTDKNIAEGMTKRGESRALSHKPTPCPPDYASESAVQDAREWIDVLGVAKRKRDALLAEVAGLTESVRDNDPTTLETAGCAIAMVIQLALAALCIGVVALLQVIF